MKFKNNIVRSILTCIWVASTAIVSAQTGVKKDTIKAKKPDYTFKAKKWCVDVDVLGGTFSRSMQNVDLLKNYSNVAESGVGYFTYSKQLSAGFDAQLGYFFDDDSHYGIGTGVKLLVQNFDLRLSRFDVQYQSTDIFGDVYRQNLTTGSAVSEAVKSTAWSIPLVFKYKTTIKNKWGFTSDVGLLFNLSQTYSYSTDAIFNYEAIYKFQTFEGNTVAVYDYSNPIGASDVLMTRSGARGNPAAYLDSLHAHGYNVGLNVRPKNSTGTVSSTQASIGFFVQPELTYALNERTSLNLGLHYYFSTFNQNASNYKLTDKVGDYTPLISSASQTLIQTYGMNLGIRYYFGKLRDRDHDGVPDRFDRCPMDSGVVKLVGCPDSDMDGIADVDDSCPHEFGLAKFKGCPDTDGDGIPDKSDSCPTVFGLAKFSGCPDTDGDGIPDRSDSCPKQKGPIQFNGCPDTDGDGLPDNLDACPKLPGAADNHGCPVGYDSLGRKIGAADSSKGRKGKGGAAAGEKKVVYSKNVHFDFNQFKLNRSSYRYLDSIVNIMHTVPEANLTIDGYSDGVGPNSANLRISNKRALAVKRYMVRKGIDAARLKAVGHGKSNPIANNRTKAGRAQNRRALMLVKSNPVNMGNDSIIEDNATAITVTPNDEKGSFTILLKTNFEENAVVTILSPNGKMLKQFQIVANKPTAFTFDAPAGLYYFTAATASTKYEARIIISQ